jgi:hypothetical protein
MRPARIMKKVVVIIQAKHSLLQLNKSAQCFFGTVQMWKFVPKIQKREFARIMDSMNFIHPLPHFLAGVPASPAGRV